MAEPDEFELYGDRARESPSPTGKPASSASSAPHVAPACHSCGSTRFEDGFVESASEGQVRWFAGDREVGVFGVKRFLVPRRPVIARRCLTCSHLDLFAGAEE